MNIKTLMRMSSYFLSTLPKMVNAIARIQKSPPPCLATKRRTSYTLRGSNPGPTD